MTESNTGIFAKYKAKCTHPSCPGELSFEHAQSAGLRYGGIIQYDPTVPGFGRCPHCKRYQMRVIETPDPPPIQGPRGFSKLPTE